MQQANTQMRQPAPVAQVPPVEAPEIAQAPPPELPDSLPADDTWLDKEPKVFENLSFDENNLRRKLKQIRTNNPDIAPEALASEIKPHVVNSKISKERYIELVKEIWGRPTSSATLGDVADIDPETVQRSFANVIGAPPLDELPDIPWSEVLKKINPIAVPEGWGVFDFIPESNLWASGFKNAADIVTGLPELPAIMGGLAKEIGGLVFNKVAESEDFGKDFPLLSAIANDYKQRYGSMKGFKYALAEDPFSIILDAVDAIIPVAKGIGLIKKGTKVGQIADKTADIAEYFDPGKHIGDAVSAGFQRWTEHMKANPSAFAEVDIQWGVDKDGNPMTTKVNLRDLAEQYGGVENVPISALVDEEMPKHIEEGIRNLYDSKHPYHQAIIGRFESASKNIAKKKRELVGGEVNKIAPNNPEEVGGHIAKQYERVMDGEYTTLSKKQEENAELLDQPLSTVEFPEPETPDTDTSKPPNTDAPDTPTSKMTGKPRLALEHMTDGEHAYRKIIEDKEIKGRSAEDKRVWLSMGPYYRREGSGSGKWGFIFDANDIETLGVTPYDPQYTLMNSGEFREWYNANRDTAPRDLNDAVRQYVQESGLTTEDIHEYLKEKIGHSEFILDQNLQLERVIAVVEDDVLKVITEETRGADPSEWQFREPQDSEIEQAGVDAGGFLSSSTDSSLTPDTPDGMGDTKSTDTPTPEQPSPDKLIFANTHAEIERLVAKDSGTRKGLNNDEVQAVVKKMDGMFANIRNNIKEKGHITVQDVKQFRTDFNKSMKVYKRRGDVVEKGSGSSVDRIQRAISEDFYNLLKAEVKANPDKFPENFDAVVELDNKEYRELMELQGTKVAQYLSKLGGEGVNTSKVVTDMLYPRGLFTKDNINTLKQLITDEDWQILQKGMLSEILAKSTHFNKDLGAKGLLNTLNLANGSGRNRLHYLLGEDMTKTLYEMASFQDRVFSKKGAWNTPWIQKIFNDDAGLPEMMMATGAISSEFGRELETLARETGLSRMVNNGKIGMIVSLGMWWHGKRVKKKLFSEDGRRAILEGRSITVPLTGKKVKLEAREIALVLDWMDKHEKKIGAAWHATRATSRRGKRASRRAETEQKVRKKAPTGRLPFQMEVY